MVVDDVHFVSRSWDCAHLHSFDPPTDASGIHAGKLNRTSIAPGTESVFHVHLLPRHSHASSTGAAASVSDGGEGGGITEAAAVETYDRALDEEDAVGVAHSALPVVNTAGP